jgi:CBS domain-containing protein
MFDIRGLSGTITLDVFLEVLGGVSQPSMGTGLTDLAEDSQKSHSEEEDDSFEESECDRMDLQKRTAIEAEIRNVWKDLCGKQESLSYCEFLAALLPQIEDVFEDVSQPMLTPRSPRRARRNSNPEFLQSAEITDWDPQQPISAYFPLMSIGENPVPVFDDNVLVSKVVKAMNDGHHRWVILQFKQQPQKRAFFEFMDITSKLVEMQLIKPAEQCLAHICCMRVGELANCSNRSAFIPVSENTSLQEILRLLTQKTTFVRRIPIVSLSGEMLHVISCGDVLQLAVSFELPRRVMKSQSARIFDRRAKMMQDSVLHDEPVVNALRIMITEHVTTCPATSRELSGDMGGIVALNVVSAADLKWLFLTGRFDMIEKSVDEFISWRTSIADADLGSRLRKERLKRFNVVSVRAGDSLYMLTQRLLASKLPRIFLQSDEISRIVGTVCARDIVREILDQILLSSKDE